MREALRTVDVKANPEAAFTIWMKHYLRRENSYMQNESQQEKFHTREPLTCASLSRSRIPAATRGGAGYSGGGEQHHHQAHRGIDPNNGTLDFLRPDDVIEISCDLSKEGLKPVTPVQVPTAQKNMIASVKEYERLAVAACSAINRWRYGR
jgi:6-phospho-beta-glucosidase